MNSRGRHEQAAAAWVVSAAGTLEKALWDLAALQHRGIRLHRAAGCLHHRLAASCRRSATRTWWSWPGPAAASCAAWPAQLAHLAGGLPSSYHRDLQLLKAPFPGRAGPGRGAVRRARPAAARPEDPRRGRRRRLRRLDCTRPRKPPVLVGGGPAVPGRLPRGGAPDRDGHLRRRAERRPPTWAAPATWPLEQIRAELASCRSWLAETHRARRMRWACLEVVGSTDAVASEDLEEHEPETRGAGLLRRSRHLLLRGLAARAGPRRCTPSPWTPAASAADELARIRARPPAWARCPTTPSTRAPRCSTDYLRHLIAGNVLRGGPTPCRVSPSASARPRGWSRMPRPWAPPPWPTAPPAPATTRCASTWRSAPWRRSWSCIAPIRELSPSRAEEMGLPGRARLPTSRRRWSAYSVNEGMWGTSVGGKETHDSWQHLPDGRLPGRRSSRRTSAAHAGARLREGPPGGPRRQGGGARGADRRAERGGQPYGIGRGMHLGDTILGIKGRVGFDAPAAICSSPRTASWRSWCCTGKQLFWKETLGNLYGSLLHEGHFFDPLARDLEGFLTSSQAQVTGEVRLTLQPRAIVVEGVRSQALVDATRRWPATARRTTCGPARKPRASRRCTALLRRWP